MLGESIVKKIFGIFLSCLLIACENNIEVVKNLGEIKDLPIISAKEVEILYSDSGKVKLRLIAPIINRYDNATRQYTEFPKGIKVEQFDTGNKVIATIEAQYAIYYEKQNLWQARNNVIAHNLIKNEQLYSEELFWDQAQGKIYSRKYSKIINEDGVFIGERGFEAKEDLSQWHMLGIKGQVNIKENFNED